LPLMITVPPRVLPTHRPIRTSQQLLIKREKLLKLFSTNWANMRSKCTCVRMEKIRSFQRKTMVISIKMKSMQLISKDNITDISFSGSVQEWEAIKFQNTENIWPN